MVKRHDGGTRILAMTIAVELLRCQLVKRLCHLHPISMHYRLPSCCARCLRTGQVFGDVASW